MQISASDSRACFAVPWRPVITFTLNGESSVEIKIRKIRLDLSKRRDFLKASENKKKSTVRFTHEIQSRSAIVTHHIS